MTQLDRRKVVLGAGLILGAGASLVVRPVRSGVAGVWQSLDAALPAQLGQWRRVELGDFVLPPGEAMGTSLYDALVLRGYASAAGEALYCVVTYGAVQDYAMQLHRPETCYPASGFAVRTLEPFAVGAGGPDLGATLMVASREDRTETVLYWTRVGRSFPRSQWQVRAAIVRGLASLSLPDGAMVRISMQRAPGAATSALLADFARALLGSLRPPARGLLLGGAR